MASTWLWVAGAVGGAFLVSRFFRAAPVTSQLTDFPAMADSPMGAAGGAHYVTDDGLDAGPAVLAGGSYVIPSVRSGMSTRAPSVTAPNVVVRDHRTTGSQTIASTPSVGQQGAGSREVTT